MKKKFREYNIFEFQKLLIVIHLIISILSISAIDYSIIKIKINKTGNINILGDKDFCLSDDIYLDPDEIYINGNNKSEIKNQYYFNETENNVTLIWKKAINSTSCLFYECEDITDIDLSNFNTSQVTEMDLMFSGCRKLNSLNLSNFNTSQVKDMWGMFSDCSKLISLNLSNFDTSQVTDMEKMFYECPNLEYINLKITKLNEGVETSKIFKDISEKYTICCNDEQLKNATQGYNQIINCIENSNNYYEFKCYQKGDFSITYNDTCEKCGFNYYQIYNDYSNNNSYINCYQSLNEGFYLDKEDLTYKLCYYSCKKCSINGDEYFHNCMECSNNYKYYLNISNYYNCYNNCSYYHYYDINTDKSYCTYDMECPVNYNKLIINKKECIDECNKDLLYKYEYNNSCYSECPNNTINNSFHCEILTNNYTQTNYIINNTILSYSDYQNNSDYSNFQYSSNIIHNSYSNIDTNEIIKNSENIRNSSYSNNISEIIKEKKMELIYNYKNSNNSKEFEIDIDGKKKILLELTTTFDEKKNENENENKTSIDLRECQYILKNEFKIPYNVSLYIFKMEVKEYGMKIPKIEYEVYYPFNEEELSILNLSICKNEKIVLYIPVTINDNIDKHNPYSGYYNNICYKAESNKGTDITLSDRKNEYIDNNMTLCEENCKIIDYNYNTKKVKCSCEIKIHIPLFNDIKFDKYKLYESFTDIKNIFNLNVVKCFKDVITKENIKNNSGFFIFMFISILFFICLIFFYLKLNGFYKNNITKIIQAKIEISKLQKKNKKKNT